MCESLRIKQINLSPGRPVSHSVKAKSNEHVLHALTSGLAWTCRSARAWNLMQRQCVATHFLRCRLRNGCLLSGQLDSCILDLMSFEQSLAVHEVVDALQDGCLASTLADAQCRASSQCGQGASLMKLNPFHNHMCTHGRLHHFLRPCPGSSSPSWISSSGPAMLPTPPIGTSGNPASDSASSDTWSRRAGGALPNSSSMLILLHDLMVMILWTRLGTKEASDRSSELSGVFSSKTAQPLASCLSVVRSASKGQCNQEGCMGTRKDASGFIK